jgi:hypothetical protein
MDAIAKRIREQPLRSIAMAVLAGAWLGYEPPRRSIMLGLLRMFVMSELRTFVDGLPDGYASVLGTSPPIGARFTVDQDAPASTIRA